MRAEITSVNTSSEGVVSEPGNASIDVGVCSEKGLGRVLYCPKPLPDESGYGFLLRVAKELEYPSPAYILGLAKISQTGLLNVQSVRRLAYVLRSNTEELTKRFYTQSKDRNDNTVHLFLDHAINRMSINFGYPRVCPKCLCEKLVCYAMWDIDLVAVCPTHRCHLISNCHACQRPISRWRASVHRCKCGADFRAVPPINASEESSLLTSLIYRSANVSIEGSRCLEEAKYSDGLMRLPLPMLLHLVHFLGMTFRMSTGVEHTLPQHLRRRLHALDLIEIAHDVLKYWPEPYLRQVRALDARSKTEMSVGAAPTGGSVKFYCCLQRKLLKPEYAFLNVELRKIEGTDYDGLV